MDHKTATVAPEQQDTRLDVFLAGCFPDLTRSRCQSLIVQGRVQVGGRPARASYRVKAGDRVTLDVPDPTPSELIPEDIPLDVVYEDADILVVNKPRGMVVHPAAGNETGTLVQALLHHCHDLSGIGGEARPGIVHRIDKDTTGLLVVAKRDAAHQALAAQIQDKTCRRIYWALLEGRMPRDAGSVDAPIGRSPADRKRMAVVERGRQAITHYRVLERFEHETLVECRLTTGRTHQIRVHMASLGHPVVGDPVYGFKKQRYRLSGQLLHAVRLELIHPRTGEPMAFEAPLPEDFDNLLQKLRKSSSAR